MFVLQVHRCEFKVWRVSAAWMASFTSLVAGAALPQHAQKHIFTHTPTHYAHLRVYTSTFSYGVSQMFSEMDLSDGEWRHTYQCVVLDKAGKICNGCGRSVLDVCICLCVCVSLSYSLTSSWPSKVGGRKEWP